MYQQLQQIETNADLGSSKRGTVSIDQGIQGGQREYLPRDLGQQRAACPLLERQSPAHHGNVLQQALPTRKGTSSKYKAISDRKCKLFEPSSENLRNADSEGLLNF